MGSPPGGGALTTAVDRDSIILRHPGWHLLPGAAVCPESDFQASIDSAMESLELEHCQLMMNTWTIEKNSLFRDLPTFLTTAVVQGEQYEYVIYDNVVSEGDSLADLGITADVAKHNFLRSHPSRN